METKLNILNYSQRQTSFSIPYKDVTIIFTNKTKYARITHQEEGFALKGLCCIMQKYQGSSVI